jgi:hypothetical protein
MDVSQILLLLYASMDVYYRLGFRRNFLSVLHPIRVTCYLLPSLYVAAFVRRTTSSTDLHPLSKRSLYFLNLAVNFTKSMCLILPHLCALDFNIIVCINGCVSDFITIICIDGCLLFKVKILFFFYT